MSPLLAIESWKRIEEEAKTVIVSSPGRRGMKSDGQMEGGTKNISHEPFLFVFLLPQSKTKPEQTEELISMWR